MATVDPPPTISRIVEVLDPGGGYYVVYVRIPPHLAAKFPDKPFGTRIEDIGLAEKDIVKFVGYTLVDFENISDRRIGDTADLFWIFQKLPGPILTGQEAYVERTVADYEEQDVAPGTAAESGLLIIDSKVMPDGKGKSVKKTVSVPSWPEHKGSQWDAEIGAQLSFTEQFVAPPDADALALPNTSFQIVNEDRSLKRVQVIPEDALNAYSLAFPVRIDLDLPKVLKSVAVEWSSQYSIGTQDTQALDYASGTSGSVSLSIPDSASSAASITANVRVTFEDFATNNLFAENRVFYMEGPVTQSSILAKLSTLYGESVILWPVFKPQSTTILVKSQSINVRANVQVALGHSWGPSSSSFNWQKSVSDDFSVSGSSDSVQLPPCIHPAITLTGDTVRTQPVSATAVMSLSSSSGASVSASKTKSGTAGASVSPAVIPATDGPTSIPTSGLHLYDMQVAPTEYTNWFKVRAVVFDASVLD